MIDILTDFKSMDPTELSTYIEDIHHSYLRKALPEIAELLGIILREHGKSHPELFQVYCLFGKQKTDLEQHLLKEETMLFPALANRKTSKEELISLTKGIIDEHVSAEDALAKLREVTDNYRIPSDVCETFIKTYEMLEEVEKDLHRHIHLENNILLKEYDLR